MAKSLFHGVIGQGGSAMPSTGGADGSPMTRAVEEAKGERFAKALGAADIEALRALPWQALLAASGTMISDWNWNTCIDGEVLPASPAEHLGNGEQADVPLLVGWCADEGMTMAHETFGGDDRPLAPQIEQAFGAEAGRLLDHYPTPDLAADQAAKVKLAGDGFIGYPTWSWGAGHAARASSPTFFYHSRRAPAVNESWSTSGPTPEQPGAFHGSEMPYVFGTLRYVTEWTIEQTDIALAECLGRYWANFVRTGNPNGPWLPPWPAYDLSDPRKLYIEPDGDVRARTDEDYDRMHTLGKLFAAAPGALRYRGTAVGSEEA